MQTYTCVEGWYGREATIVSSDGLIRQQERRGWRCSQARAHRVGLLGLGVGLLLGRLNRLVLSGVLPVPPPGATDADGGEGDLRIVRRGACDQLSLKRGLEAPRNEAGEGEAPGRGRRPLSRTVMQMTTAAASPWVMLVFWGDWRAWRRRETVAGLRTSDPMWGARSRVGGVSHLSLGGEPVLVAATTAEELAAVGLKGGESQRATGLERRMGGTPKTAEERSGKLLAGPASRSCLEVQEDPGEPRKGGRGKGGKLRTRGPAHQAHGLHGRHGHEHAVCAERAKTGQSASALPRKASLDLSQHVHHAALRPGGEAADTMCRERMHARRLVGSAQTLGNGGPQADVTP